MNAVSIDDPRLLKLNIGTILSCHSHASTEQEAVSMFNYCVNLINREDERIISDYRSSNPNTEFSDADILSRHYFV